MLKNWKRFAALGLTGTMMFAGALSAAADSTVENAVEEASGDYVKLGVQMYNFVAAGDWSSIDSQEGINELLTTLAEAGYDGVEWCNFMLNGEYLDLDETKAVMDELGLETAGMHFHYNAETFEDDCATVVERCLALGTDKLIFAYSTPATFGIEADEEGNWTPEQVDEWVEGINGVIYGLEAASEGTDIEVLYHNHATELLEGSTGEYALDMIDVAAKEIDVYWTAKGLSGAVDVALAYVDDNADSVQFLHVKDGLDGSMVTGEMCGWGKGTYDIQDIVDVAASNENIGWVIVENDHPESFGTTGLEDAIQSAEYARENINFER